MSDRIEVDAEEVLRVFRFLEDVHDLMHQPMYYRDPERIERFVQDNYAEVKHLYYRVVWNWLPEHSRREIRDS